MIYRFPHDAAFLPRTKLSYANLPGILSDGKRDRAARVPGFVVIQLGERCLLIFMREGEPFHAAQLHPLARGSAALSEILRVAGTESERGEGGQIGFFGASEDQLGAMLSTLVHPPIAWEEPLDAARPELLFPRLRAEGFSGVLELSADGRFHYLTFEDGVFRNGFFAERDRSVPVPDFIRSLFDRASAMPAAALYPAVEGLPVLASPGHVDLYRRVIGGLLRELALSLGRETALELMVRARSSATLRHPAVAAFDITPEGRIKGDPVSSPDGITEAVAAWVTDALIAAGDHHVVDPIAVIEKVGRDSRFVLQEQGFFQRLPWALAI